MCSLSKSKLWCLFYLCRFWIPWPRKPIFQQTLCKVSEFKILVSDQRSEVIWWPLRGQNEKIMSYLDSLAQKTYISIYIMQNEWIQNFGLWSEVRGHLVTSTRSKWKNIVIFGFLGPKNLYFNIHHVKLVNSKFWPLIRGQRSFVDLYEVRMKK